MADISWKVIRGPNAAGFIGASGIVIKADSMTYTTGGIGLPISGFVPTAVIAVDGEGGGYSGHFSDGKLLIYKDGAEASGTLSDVTIVMI